MRCVGTERGGALGAIKKQGGPVLAENVVVVLQRGAAAFWGETMPSPPSSAKRSWTSCWSSASGCTLVLLVAWSILCVLAAEDLASSAAGVLHLAQLRALVLVFLASCSYCVGLHALRRSALVL